MAEKATDKTKKAKEKEDKQSKPKATEAKKTVAKPKADSEPKKEAKKDQAASLEKKPKKNDDPKGQPAPKEDAKKGDAKAEKASEAPESEDTAEKPKKITRRKNVRHVPEGNVYIMATYNNTLITVTDLEGNVIAWSSAGGSGFKGTRKATPYAASVASENASKKAKIFGLERIHVYINGVGSGREQSIRSLQANGLSVLSITDKTPIPHNGTRRPRVRRV